MARYQNSTFILKTEEGRRYYSTVIPTDVEVSDRSIEIVARLGDRWDTLANKYFGTPTLWYVIANANNKLNGSIFVKPGTRIIIPLTYYGT